MPDDKDWTWVLQRPCPDCGYAAADTDPRDVPRLVREQAALWPGVLARADARTRPAPTVWSPVEYGCHVRDVLRLGEFRLGLMLNDDGPTFANWDQDATAVDDRYDEQDPLIVAAEIEAAAAGFAAAYDAVTTEQWARRGLRSDGAVFTVESFARYFIHDPVHHLWDIDAER